MDESIEQSRWESFLDHFAKTSQGLEARLEILGADLGDQESAAWLPFSGMSYDPHHGSIFVMVGGITSRYPVHLTHRIDHPRSLTVHHSAEGDIQSVLVVGEDERKTLVSLRPQGPLHT
ncbi:MAG: DUF5335 family protein [Candidatus Tectimicrobiota bacterium]